MKTSDAADLAAQTLTAAAEPAAETPDVGEQAEVSEEAFEATIVRLDRAAAERLFRKAGE